MRCEFKDDRHPILEWMEPSHQIWYTVYSIGRSVGFGDKLPRNWRGHIRVTATLVSFDHHTIRRQPARFCCH